MWDALAALATVVLWCVAMVSAPSSAECPRGWYVNGVRPDGRFGCRPTPPPEPAVRGHEQDAPPRHDPEIHGWITCGSRERPVVISDHQVGCF